MNNLKHDLEDCIDLGYQWIEKIEEEYRNPPNGSLSVVLSKYYRLVGEWEEQVKKILPNNAKRRVFSLAKSEDPTYESGKSVDVQNLIKSIRAKINKLEEFRKEETQQPTISLTGTQARIYVDSTDNSINIAVKDLNILVKELELEFNKNYSGKDKEETLKLVNELKKTISKNDKPKASKILGLLLTRGSEVAQIISLIIQILTVLNFA